jgi:hypothetical protein
MSSQLTIANRQFKVVCQQCKTPFENAVKSSETKIISANCRVSICTNCSFINFKKWGNLPVDIQRLVFEFAGYELEYLKLSSRILNLSVTFTRLVRSEDPRLQQIKNEELVEMLSDVTNKNVMYFARSTKKHLLYELSSQCESKTYNRVIGSTEYPYMTISNYTELEQKPLSEHFHTGDYKFTKPAVYLSKKRIPRARENSETYMYEIGTAYRLNQMQAKIDCLRNILKRVIATKLKNKK